MKVIYISYDGMCDPVGASQVLPYLIELSKKNIEFYLISFEKPERFKSFEKFVKSQIDNTSITWFPLRYTKNPPVVSTVFDLYKIKKLCKRLCKNNQIDFIHARSYISALAAVKIKRSTQVPFVFDMRGFWADERIDGGIWSFKNPLYKFIYKYFKEKEKQLLIKSDKIVSLTQAAKTYMIDNWNVSESKIHVIPCAADYKHFIFSEKTLVEKLKEKHCISLSAGKTLMYVGSTGTWYLLQQMFDFYSVFRTHFAESRFVLCINESNPLIESMIQKYLNEVVVVEQLPRSDMPAILSLADYSIMFIKPAFSKMASSPIKLGESLAMGVPVICNAGVGDMEFVEKDDFGFVAKDLNTAEYERICYMLAEKSYDPNDIRKRSEPIYDLKYNVDKYYTLYKEVKTDKYH